MSSRFPPISVFEDILDPRELDSTYSIEALTNDRRQEQAGQLARVPPADRISGPGSTPVMAHLHLLAAPVVSYAASSTTAAIAETRFHRQRFLRFTSEPAQKIEMRESIGQPDPQCPLTDILD